METIDSPCLGWNIVARLHCVPRVPRQTVLTWADICMAVLTSIGRPCRGRIDASVPLWVEALSTCVDFASIHLCLPSITTSPALCSLSTPFMFLFASCSHIDGNQILLPILTSGSTLLDSRTVTSPFGICAAPLPRARRAWSATHRQCI